MDELLQELENQLRQAQQNFNYAGQEYLDAAIMEMNTVNEKFRAMLREKRREKDGQKTISG
ncbi:hypothetical protein [Tepidimicrobium xylanilyticum]|uniref:hypothetical protein n=1 Tax=Tepidimicrobium xylanilyticum TaxID=1123352 RepID=UPI0026510F55|nr:hypothetical protein [Tepidimicrobium xylanilyticum]GMG96818.1 hypothetical protein EN5CB1_16440 [Tepidimicrobium xylanilyticum]